MGTPYYVGRVHDEEVLKILENEQQYSIDNSDDQRLGHSLRRIDIKRLKYAKSAFRLMRDIAPNSIVLLVGTKWWRRKFGVDAKTVLGYGITASDHEGPYRFKRSRGDWRHRLKLQTLLWVDRKHHGVALKKLGIQSTFPPSRFFQDRRGLAEQVLMQLEKQRLIPAIELDELSLTPPSNQFNFVPGHRVRQSGAKSTSERDSFDMDLIQNRWQTSIYKQLVRGFGKENVGTEIPISGGKVDVVVKKQDGFVFYEIKTSNSIQLCIREALGQLLEYAYFAPPRGRNRTKALIIVSGNGITPEAGSYLICLRKRFGLPIHYQRYDTVKGTLEPKLY